MIRLLNRPKTMQELIKKRESILDKNEEIWSHNLKRIKLIEDISDQYELLNIVDRSIQDLSNLIRSKVVYKQKLECQIAEMERRLRWMRKKPYIDITGINIEIQVLKLEE